MKRAFYVFFGLLIGASIPIVMAQPTGTGSYPVYAVSHFADNATQSVLTGAGVLHTICVNNAGASSNIATVYDNTAASGTVVAIIDTVELNGRCLLYDMDINTGITIVTATGTASDMTVTYRALR